MQLSVVRIADLNIKKINFIPNSNMIVILKHYPCVSLEAWIKPKKD